MNSNGDYIDNQQYQVHGQTQFQARGGMTPAMNRPVFNKQPVGYMGAPNNMGSFVNQQRNMYNMGQQQMPGKYFWK